MGKKFYLDLLERTAWTFVQAFAAVWLVFDRDVAFDVENLQSAAIAAGIAAVKGLAASFIGDKDSAATLPSGGGE